MATRTYPRSPAVETALADRRFELERGSRYCRGTGKKEHIDGAAHWDPMPAL